MKNSKRILALVSAMAVLAFALAMAGAWLRRPAMAASWFWEEPAQDEPAADEPIPSALQDDGMLRVRLSSLGEPGELTLTLAGSYTVENNAGFRFAQGTQIALVADGESVLLKLAGLTLNMGPSLTLTRHAAGAGEENGIYIRESEKETLYCGDLSISAKGGALRAILRIHIEDYLYGVVAYEMSDSFPLEALKAQAVAARTYAMGRKWVSAAKEYDVVDTTADQVYKGYDAQYTNVVRAVDETRGIVGVYNGGFAMCYYTASNGGQTALPTDIWGGDGDYGYLDTRDDPYDLENPRSLVNSVTFRADAADLPELRSMLAENLPDAARRAGLSFGEIRMEDIAAIEPVAPLRMGSYMYARMRFLLNVSTRSYGWSLPEGALPFRLKPATSARPGASLMERLLAKSPLEQRLGDWRAERAQVPVELTVYDQIKNGLSLGLSRLDCELVSVAEQEGMQKSFTLEMRRFGHGIGMSQRGAQQMAGQHAFSYLQILQFYYPGLSIERIDWPARSLTAISELPGGVGVARPTPTPKATPAPLPEPQAGEYIAKVRLASASSTLNVRQEPSTVARVLDALESGRRVIVSEELEDGWARIRTAELEGYAKLEYLERE